jgi:predicted DsbA family dithiol-disulfide isomerase
MPNTLDAHRLIYWAYPPALKARIVERLFKAHFTDGLDIGDRSLLIALAQECGMDGDAAFDLFSRRDDIDVLRSEIEISRTLIKQVPFFIFAEDIVVPGGQSEEALKWALAKAIAKSV